MKLCWVVVSPGWAARGSRACSRYFTFLLLCSTQVLYTGTLQYTGNLHSRCLVFVWSNPQDTLSPSQDTALYLAPLKCVLYSWLTSSIFFPYRLLLRYCHFSMHSHSLHFFCRKDQHFKSRAHSNQTCGRGDGPKPDLLPWPKANAPPFKPIHFFPRAAKLPPDTLGLRLARVTWIVFNLDAIGSKSHARLQQNICNIRYKASPSNQFF